MEDRIHDRFKRAAKRERDRKIKDSLRSTGRKPPKNERKLNVNAEFHDECWDDRKAG